MLNGLDDLMRTQGEALKLRSYRQELLAANIANADTPNYKAVDFDFRQALESAATPQSKVAGTAERSATSPTMLYRTPAQSAIDGNSVEMDAERARFADNTVRYEAAMRTLSAQIKAMLAAIQG